MIYSCKFRYDLNEVELVRWANQITAANAGRASQFRFAVNGLVPGVAEFHLSAGTESIHTRKESCHSGHPADIQHH